MINALLAAQAKAELDHRLKVGPAAVAGKKISRADAEREINAWETIRQWFAGEATPLLRSTEDGYEWNDLAGVAERAVERAEHTLATNDDQPRRDRLAVLWSMAIRLRGEAESMARLNTALRNRAETMSAAA